MTKTTKRGYECKKPWPEDCFVQSGGSGLVLSRSGKKPYTTAFFEAFPRDPDTFIRGEGETIEEAEDKAYQKLLSYQACDDHDFERKTEEGRGKCRHCGLDSLRALPNLQACGECGVVGVKKEHPKDEGNKICLSCLAGSIGEQILKDTPVFDAEKERQRFLASDSDRINAAEFFSDQIQDKCEVMILKKLMQDDAFLALSEEDRNNELSSLRLMPYKVIMHPRMELMEHLLKMFPRSQELEYLDEAEYLEMVVSSMDILEGLSLYAYLGWQRAKEESDAGKTSLTIRINSLYEGMMEEFVPKIGRALRNWAENPPADASERQRITTRQEFKDSMGEALKSLSKMAKPMNA